MRRRFLRSTALALALCSNGAFAKDSQRAGDSIDPVAAAEYFREAASVFARDGGQLWGRDLAGPILFVEPATRAVVANRADPKHLLARNGAVFAGTLSPDILVANTAVDWAGLKWTMVMWPLPNDATRRATVLAHESWHRIQDQLGFPSSGAANQHLDTRDGRTWLQLEWRALAAALANGGDERMNAIRDALLFRACRRAHFPAAAEQERAMEMHEGLAEYTGVALNGASDQAQYVVDANLKEAPTKPSFVRSFAYASGPAYGILLDAVQPDWRKGLTKSDDLGALLEKALGIELPSDVEVAAQTASLRYGGESLAASELNRDADRQKLLASYRSKFIDTPVLSIPLRQMKMQFDPGELIPIEGRGTVYPKIRVVDVWGILDVSNGALMESHFSKITVSTPVESAEIPVKGDGWTLQLNPGWAMKPGQRRGDYTLVETK
jgi:hypothetical protein